MTTKAQMAAAAARRAKSKSHDPAMRDLAEAIERIAEAIAALEERLGDR